MGYVVFECDGFIFCVVRGFMVVVWIVVFVVFDDFGCLFQCVYFVDVCYIVVVLFHVEFEVFVGIELLCVDGELSHCFFFGFV